MLDIQRMCNLIHELLDDTAGDKEAGRLVLSEKKQELARLMRQYIFERSGWPGCCHKQEQCAECPMRAWDAKLTTDKKQDTLPNAE